METQQRTAPKKEYPHFFKAAFLNKGNSIVKAGRAPDNSWPIKNSPTFNEDIKNSHNPAVKIYSGMVRFFVEDNGYGFISENTTKKSYFISRSSLLEKISTRDQVIFEIENTLSGHKVTNVRKINSIHL